MPRFLAIDWDAGHVHLLAGSAGKGGLKLERALAWPEEQPPTAATADGFGQRLRERLKEAGVAAAPLLVAVGRDRLVLKDVRYPAVPPHEEPGIVRFQAVKELADGDDVVIDYQAAEAPEPSGERKALAVALKRSQLAAWQGVARAAGLKLAGVVPRAFGAVACLRRMASPPPEPGTAFAVLTVGAKGGEFAVARGDGLALARTVPGQALTADAALVAEVRRNLAVYAGQAPQHPVRALYVAEADGDLGVGDRLRDTLAIPVYRFDPLSGLDAPVGARLGAFAGAAGLLLLHGRGTALPINFVKPREPKPPRDPNRRLLALAAALIAALAVGGAALGYSRISATNKVMTDLVAEKADLDRQLLQTLDPEKRRGDAVDAWLGSEVVYLDELYDLTAAAPDVNRLRLTQITGNPNPPVAGKPSKFAGRVELKGLVGEDTRPLTALMTELDVDGFHRVEPKKMEPNTSGSASRRQFVQQWSTRYDVMSRPPAKYDRKFTATPPPRRDRQGGPGGAPGGAGFPDLFGGAP